MDLSESMDQSVEKSTGMEDSSNDNERQSLLRRSKQILGEDVQLGEARSNRGRRESPEQSTGPEVLDKRREQVRKAQRIHRQRTKTYVKSLEREVLRLRSSENEALATAEKLQRQVDILLGTLAEHSISVPFGLEAALPIRPDIGHVTLNPRDPSLPLLNLTFPSSGSTTLPTSRSSPQKWINDTVQPEVFPPVDDQSTVPVPEIQTSLLHDPRVGIDFVLKLERPCLAHLRSSHLDHTEEEQDLESKEHAHKVSGHLFTASLCLWKPTIPTRAEKETYDMSAKQISRLLENSFNIGVDKDHITPVQLWHRLREFDCDERLQKKALERLTEEVARHVRCLVYGAMMDLEVVNKILSEIFLNSDVSQPQ